VHDPDLAERRAEGRKRGGIVRSQRDAVLPPDTPDLALKTVADVITLLGQTINQTRTGKLAVNVANAIGVLTGVLLRALEGGDVETRLAALEAKYGSGKRIA
jgi:hypothetical protein